MPPPRRKPSRSVVEQPRASAAAVRSADIIRIGLADDHALFRGELRTRLEEQTDFAVAGEASSPNETVAMCSSVTPHVLLLDVAMRGAEGFSLLERVRNLQLDTRIVMLTTAMPRNEVVRALQLGARGIVLKDAPARSRSSPRRARLRSPLASSKSSARLRAATRTARWQRSSRSPRIRSSTTSRASSTRPACRTGWSSRSSPFIIASRNSRGDHLSGSTLVLLPFAHSFYRVSPISFPAPHQITRSFSQLSSGAVVNI
jgi:DNA-binding NarL/FixJ family response regulator